MKTTDRIAIFLFLCLSAVVCTVTPVSSANAATVDTPVQQFLDFYFHDYKRDLPEKSQLPQLATFVTPELLTLFKAAMQGEECYARKYPEGGPPYIEGDLFSSLFEGATSATTQLIAEHADTATIAIEWTNDANVSGDPPFVWIDQVALVRMESGWRIADFIHLGTWDFMMKGTVSQILRAVASECVGISKTVPVPVEKQ